MLVCISWERWACWLPSTKGSFCLLSKLAQALKVDKMYLPVPSPLGRDPSVSRAWAFFPGGPAASPGLDSGLIRRPHPSPPGGAMTTACAQGSRRAGAESALPACLLPHPPGLGPLPKVLLSVTTKTVFNKQWRHQLGNRCLNGHQVTNLPHLGRHVLPLPTSLAETAPPQTAGLGDCMIQAASDRALSRLSLAAP